MAVNKAQLDKAIDELFPIEVGQTYFYDGKEVVVVAEVAEGFQVRVLSGEVILAPKGSLKTKAELSLKK
jgi:hypothetical protein